MEKDLLYEVIEAEKEIQKCIELEKAGSREWLDQARKEFEEEAAREEKAIEEAGKQSLARAESEAEARASEMESNARRSAERIAAVQDETLRRVLGGRLKGILPG